MKELTEQDGKSLDLIDENLKALKTLYPEAFTEDGIDFGVLRQLLGDKVADGEEKYGLTWYGKKKARQIALTPSLGTLRPCPEESVDWETTQNLFIEGDNLEVLKLLQKSYANKVKMIYIDPPYNKDKDFVYPDKFHDNLDTYLRYTGQKDADGYKFSSNTESSGRKHTNWLNMMYPRLKLAKNLLKQDGAIFISIDDIEVNGLRAICNEIFGEENFVAQIVWQKSKKGDAKLIALVHEYILCYVKDKVECLKRGNWRIRKKGVDEVLEKYQFLRKKFKNNHDVIRAEMMNWYRGLKDGDYRKNHKHYNWSDERGLYFAADFAGPDDGRENRPRHDIFHPVTGRSCKKPSTGWRWDETKTNWALAETPPRIHFGEDETTIPNRKSYLKETAFEPYNSHFYQDGRTATLQVEGLLGKGVFSFPKNTQRIGKLIRLLAEPSDILVDFFGGSGSTAHACMETNVKEEGLVLRYILVQLPELLDAKKKEQKVAFKFCENNGLPTNVAEIGKERIRRAAAKIKEENPDYRGDLQTSLFLTLMTPFFWTLDYFNGDVPTSMTRDLPVGVSAFNPVSFRQNCSWAARRLGSWSGSRRTVTLCFSLLIHPWQWVMA